MSFILPSLLTLTAPRKIKEKEQKIKLLQLAFIFADGSEGNCSIVVRESTKQVVERKKKGKNKSSLQRIIVENRSREREKKKKEIVENRRREKLQKILEEKNVKKKIC